jgi:hypothetical protein
MEGKQFVKLSCAVILAALLSCGEVATLAQIESGKATKESRIALKRGRASAVVKGSVAWGRSDSHKLAAREGQKLTLKLASSNAQVLFALFAPDGKIFLDAVAVREWSGELPQKGDYTITVVNNEEDSSSSPYTLEVKLK